MMNDIDNNDLMPEGLIFGARDLDLGLLQKSDCHLHTSWTDGQSSVSEVYEKAVSAGLETILYSEHSRKTSVDWFGDFANEVRQLPTFPCRAYVGTEVKVETRAGDIDTVPEISEQCDFVMASVHRLINERDDTLQFSDVKPDLAVDIEYDLSWAVLSNVKVDILGHMFGMSYRRFRRTPPETKIKKLIRRAAEFGVAVEINSHYHPSVLRMIELCAEYDAKICFGSNAHALDEVGGVMTKLRQEIERS